MCCFFFSLIWNTIKYAYVHTTSKALLCGAGVSTLPYLRVSILFVCLLLLCYFFARSLFIFGLFHFCFWSDFVAGCCCCCFCYCSINAGALMLVFCLCYILVHINTNHTQSQYMVCCFF